MGLLLAGGLLFAQPTAHAEAAPALMLRVIRGGELARIELDGQGLRYRSTADPERSELHPLAPAARQQLLAQAEAALGQGDGRQTCRHDDAFVSLRIGDRHARMALCVGGDATEQSWRELLSLVARLLETRP